MHNKDVLNSLVTEICKCNQELETSTVKGDKYYTVSFNVYYIMSRVYYYKRALNHYTHSVQ